MKGYPQIIFRSLLVVLFLCGSAAVSFGKSSESLKIEAQKYYWGKKVNQNYKKALELYEQAARQGDPEAQFIAGGMYYTGKGAEVDLRKAFALLSTAAEQGKTSPEAQQALAEMYINGNVVPQNFLKAKKLFNLAADAGKKEAQNELGFMYYVGKGTEKDFNEALYWFEKAAEQGMPIAQYNLGMMWYSGNADKGVDLVRAYAWLSLSAAAGHPGAQGMKQRIEPMLSPEELTQAQQLSSSIYNKLEGGRL